MGSGSNDPEFLRIINVVYHWNEENNRFSTTAFRPSSTNKGISVVCIECIDDLGNHPCQHIEQFYPDVAGNPIVYWEIPKSIIPEACQTPQETSKSGDICHHEIFGLSRRQAERIFETVYSDLSSFTICKNGNTEILQLEDLTAQQK